MEFRWLSLIALWTLLAGPVFGPPARSTPRPGERARAAVVNPAPVATGTSRR
jgi:hypothetical protein